jgi:hypothetical protein
MAGFLLGITSGTDPELGATALDHWHDRQSALLPGADKCLFASTVGGKMQFDKVRLPAVTIHVVSFGSRRQTMAFPWVLVGKDSGTDMNVWF